MSWLRTGSLLYFCCQTTSICIALLKEGLAINESIKMVARITIGINSPSALTNIGCTQMRWIEDLEPSEKLSFPGIAKYVPHAAQIAPQMRGHHDNWTYQLIHCIEEINSPRSKVGNLSVVSIPNDTIEGAWPSAKSIKYHKYPRSERKIRMNSAVGYVNDMYSNRSCTNSR